MGLNNDVERISKSIISKNQQEREEKAQKEYTKELQLNFKELLTLELLENLKNNNNIFDLDFKLYIINQLLEDYKATHNSDIFSKYESNIKMFLISNYYTIANQTRLIFKKQNESTKNNSDQQQIKNEILQIKKQQEAEKLKKLQQQNEQKRQQVQQVQKSDKMQIVKIILIILSLPLIFIGLMVYAVIYSAAHMK